MKKKKVVAFLILVAVIGLVAIPFAARNKNHGVRPSQEKGTNLLKDGDKIRLSIENVEFEAEIAQSPMARAKGLGGRSELCPQCGMLFLFENDGQHAFWMKDTLIPLDIIWIDKNWQVVDFVAFAQPQAGRSDEELPIYRQKIPARYVLELPGGTVEKIRGFKVGSRVELEG